ncbi:GNAT family N-acetyltransferase [uncultured Winogradskyella sp.]|uniref:GNAT family N-acetyltransferase n=1 Tax=uncultured Winogradskyella sp. TaxID=395353 RepID=UPI00262D3B6B|nr:GNAT family N-acetyltransferase [uncultured Winogradskyella sp.]
MQNSLYVVTVIDQNQKVVGIAPFYIQNKFGVKVLQSIPVHFGDFYEVVIANQDAVKLIIDHLKSFKKWNVVKIFNYNNTSNTFNLFIDNGFTSKKIVDILSPKFKQLTFDEFLKTISKNSRNQYKKKLRRLTREGEISFVVAKTWQDYMEHFESTKKIYNMRWEGDDRPLLSDDYYKMRNEALQPLFEKEKALLYLLKLNNETIAFRLGFLNNKTFYDWKVSHNPKFDYYSPGFLTVGLIIEHLISTDNHAFNFMTGNYQYKRSWTNNNEDSTNYELLYAKRFSIGELYLRYRETYRDKLKEIASKIKRTK